MPARCPEFVTGLTKEVPPICQGHKEPVVSDVGSRLRGHQQRDRTLDSHQEDQRGRRLGGVDSGCSGVKSAASCISHERLLLAVGPTEPSEEVEGRADVIPVAAVPSYQATSFIDEVGGSGDGEW